MARLVAEARKLDPLGRGGKKPRPTAGDWLSRPTYHEVLQTLLQGALFWSLSPLHTGFSLGGRYFLPMIRRSALV